MSQHLLKEYSDICPATNSIQTIEVSYIINSSLDKGTSYIKQRYKCPNKMKCKISECPIFKNALDKFS